MKKVLGFIVKVGVLVNAAIAGLTVFFAFRKKQVHNKRDLTQDNFILFGGKQERYPAKEIQSPMYSVYFGGLDMDLSDAEVEGDYLTIDVEVMFGGVNLVVPSHWNITINNLGTLFGGISKDFESDLEMATIDVMINAKVTFGGLSIVRAEYAGDDELVESEDDEVESLETWEANDGFNDLENEVVLEEVEATEAVEELEADVTDEADEAEADEAEVDEAVDEDTEAEDETVSEADDELEALDALDDDLEDLKELDGVDAFDEIDNNK